MMTIWRVRTLREKLLLAFLAFAFCGVIFVQVVALPLVDERQRRLASLEAAREEFLVIREGASRIESFRVRRSERPASGPVRSTVTATARDMDVAITRVQPGEDDRLTVWIDAVETRQLFEWLLLLRERHGLHVLQATVRAGADDTAVATQLVIGQSESLP